MSEKIIGYLLVFVGLVIMGVSSFSVYSVFSGRSKPVNLFNLPGVGLDLGSFGAPEGMPVGPSTKTELVSADVINQPMNLFGHILLMGFILNLGFRISSLGVQFVRPIKVTLKESKSIIEAPNV